jgi:4-hydroxybenzoate polyprenyltransferase
MANRTGNWQNNGLLTLAKCPEGATTLLASPPPDPAMREKAIAGLPLVVDLDGTLIRTDSLHETLLDTLRARPHVLWKLPQKLLGGRAALKEFLAREAKADAESWPVHEDFVAYLEQEAAGGRRIVLATAADQSIANAMMRRFPFFSGVIASDGRTNLKGKAKAERLQQEFPDGFAYAGNSSADMHIWAKARHNIVVNAPVNLTNRVRAVGTGMTVFPREVDHLGRLRRSLRLHQWAKNALIFVPLVLGGKVHDPQAWAMAILGFLAMGCAASATYLVNDLWDLPNDRRHWSKRWRPLASGEMSVAFGVVLSIAGLVTAFLLTSLVNMPAVAILSLYVVVTLSYSFILKAAPIVDVMTLASLFTMRLGFGIVLTQVRLSPWLLVFSMFVFLSLSLAKRHAEIIRMTEMGMSELRGRGYFAKDAPLTLACGMAAMLGAVLILVLYLIEDAFPRGFYANPWALWAAPMILFLFLGRIWLLCQRGLLRDDPVAFALKDPVSLVLGGLMAVSFGVAIVGVGGP